MKFRFLILTGILLSNLSYASASETVSQCPTGEHWVKAHFRKAYIRANGTPISAASVSAHCKPNPPSYSKWKDRFKNEPSSRWTRKREKKRKWTIEDQERVLDALADLPTELLLDTVIALFRLEKSSGFDRNPAAGEAGEIALYDAAFESKKNLARILSHELAHELYRQLSNAEKDQYRSAADWILVKNSADSGGYRVIPNRDNDSYVEEDGPESLTEDFSNNIEYFLFDPSSLQRKTPKVHAWIRNHFGDKFKLAERTGK